MVPKRYKRNVKIVFPSTITTFSMIFGFIAILLATSGDITRACYCLMISIIMDGLDGKVARMTDTASDFGIQYDSLADLVAFGVTPCVIYSRYFLHEQVKDQVYYLLPIMFLTCSAIRLARFNVTASIYGKSSFTGLPTPASAFSLTMLPLFVDWGAKSPLVAQLGIQDLFTREDFFRFSIVLVITLSLSMISTLRFDTPAAFWLKKFPYRWMNYTVIGLFLCVLFFVSFPLFGALVAIYYLFSTFLRSLIAKIRRTEQIHVVEPET